MHNLIIGQTVSGKTTLAKRICSNLKNQGHGCLVLDPFLDDWNCHHKTKNVDEFITLAKNSRNCFLFIDESAENLGHYDEHNLWLATRSRHWGHSAFFISQRLQLISVTARTQCSKLYLFNCSLSDSKILSDEYNDKILLTANELGKGEYIYKNRFRPAQKFRLF